MSGWCGKPYSSSELVANLAPHVLRLGNNIAFYHLELSFSRGSAPDEVPLNRFNLTGNMGRHLDVLHYMAGDTSQA